MNIFAGLKQYATKFQVTNTRDFIELEIQSVDHAVVVASQYGKSVCFYMKAGGQKYIPLSRDSSAEIGDSVDLSVAKILTLEKDGESINRIEI